MDKGPGESSVFNAPELNLNVRITYFCGKCGHDEHLKPTDDILCKRCAARVLYKKRENIGFQCEAR